MDIQVWADFHCPFCYVGKRRLNRALEMLGQRDAEVRVRSFLLNPDPGEGENGITLMDYVAGQYGADRASVLQNFAQREAEARAEGLPMDMGRARFGDMRDAHRLHQFALSRGLGSAFFDRAQRGLFAEGLLLSDRETLLRLAEASGLPRGDAEAVLSGDGFRAELAADDGEARRMDIDYVPYFILNVKVHFSGAVSLEECIAALRKAEVTDGAR